MIGKLIVPVLPTGIVAVSAKPDAPFDHDDSTLPWLVANEPVALVMLPTIAG